MALYDTSDAIMCRAFPMTLRGVAQGWYNRLPLASIHYYDQLAREFDANFLTSARPKPTAACLLGMRQKEDEPLGPYLACFAKEIRAIPDAHPSLVIQAIMVGIRPSHLFYEYLDHDDTLVITACIANAHVKRIMINTWSSANILYFDTFLKLDMTNQNLTPMTSTLTGFTGDAIITVGIATLPMIFDDEPRTKTLMVVELPSAVISTYHHSMKFPTSAGVEDVRSDPRGIKHLTPEASEAGLKENLDLLEDHRAEAYLKTALPRDSGSTLQSKCPTLNDRHGRPSTQEGQGQRSWTLPWKTRPEMGGSLSHRPSYLR
ncbi:hypothetical protein BHE74_00045698 [Ensete ventricosum]|nr:hypothetical protein BHE74_00045698 [Ensete ventricosum]